MKIYCISATTGYTGFTIPVRRYVTSKKAIEIVSKEAFNIYKKKMEADMENLSRFNLRLIISEMISNDQGIFRGGVIKYRDYWYDGKKIVFIKEQVFDK